MELTPREQTYTDESAPYIEKWGGKLGGLEFLREKGPDWLKEITPDTVFVEHGKDWDQRLPDLDMGESNYIVRGSHRNDFHGLVDAIPTFRDQQWNEIRGSIADIREETQKQNFVGYAKYEDPDFDGKITIGIQPFHDSMGGSIIAHPNRPDVFLISRLNRGRVMASTIYNANTKKAKEIGFSTGTHGEVTYEGLVQIYRAIEETGLVKSGWAFQVEFAGNPHRLGYVTQVRTFKRYATPEHFDVPGGAPTLTIGFTGPEGIELPLVVSEHGVNPDIEQPWALMKTNHECSVPLTFQPQNLHTYLIAQVHGGLSPSLDHRHFRIAQKAEITIFEQEHYMQRERNRFMEAGFYEVVDTEGLIQARIRIVSNGIRNRIERIN